MEKVFRAKLLKRAVMVTKSGVAVNCSFPLEFPHSSDYTAISLADSQVLYLYRESRVTSPEGEFQGGGSSVSPRTWAGS